VLNGRRSALHLYHAVFVGRTHTLHLRGYKSDANVGMAWPVFGFSI